MKELMFRRIVTYLPPLAFIIFAPLASMFPTLLASLSWQYVLALIGLALLGVGFHLDSRYTEAISDLSQLRFKITELEHTQATYLDRTRRPVFQSSLATGFSLQAAAGSRVGVLRVFAISSQQILSFLRFEDFTIGQCSLLLRGFTEDDLSHKEFESQIMLAVRDWNRLARDGKIASLTIRSYDFLPTEYQVLFDDRAMLLGMYESDPSDYSEVRVRQPFYVDGANVDGRAMIKEYQDRFDRLFEMCETCHGTNRYKKYCYPETPEALHAE